MDEARVIVQRVHARPTTFMWDDGYGGYPRIRQLIRNSSNPAAVVRALPGLLVPHRRLIVGMFDVAVDYMPEFEHISIDDRVRALRSFNLLVASRG
jgi:hypothetical protein